MAGPAPARTWTAIGRARVPVAVLAYAVAALLVAVRAGSPPASSTSQAGADAFLVAGLALMGVGALNLPTSRDRTVGLLAFAAGILWFATSSTGIASGWPLFRSLGLVVAPMLVPLLVHLACAASGQAARRSVRRTLVTLYALAVFVSLARPLVFDPANDTYCGGDCAMSAFLVRGINPTGAVVTIVGLLTVLAAGLFLVTWGTVTLARASRPAQHVLWPILIPGVALGIVLVAGAVTALTHPADVALQPPQAGLVLARSLAVTGMAAGIAWAFLAARRRTAAVRRLTTDLGAAPPPGTLESALARALGDPGLRVAYWLPDADTWVDSTGAWSRSRP